MVSKEPVACNTYGVYSKDEKAILQVLLRDARDRSRVRRYAPDMSTRSICGARKTLKAHNDERENSDDEFDAFAEELDSNWYNLIAYD